MINHTLHADPGSDVVASGGVAAARGRRRRKISALDRDGAQRTVAVGRRRVVIGPGALLESNRRTAR